MIIEGQQPTSQYRLGRKIAKYDYREICDMVGRYQFKAFYRGHSYLFVIHNIHQLFTEREFRNMMRYDNYGEGAAELQYSDLDAELLYAIVKNMMSIPAQVENYIEKFGKTYCSMICLDDPEDDEVIQKLENLLQIAYNDMRSTEVETVNVLNLEKTQKSQTLYDQLQNSAIIWKRAQQTYQEEIKRLINNLKSGHY